MYRYAKKYVFDHVDLAGGWRRYLGDTARLVFQTEKRKQNIKTKDEKFLVLLL